MGCARREGCAVWFGLCRKYERLLLLVRADGARGRPRRWSDGDVRLDGEGRCACSIGMVPGVWAAGLCGCCGERCLGLGTAPAGDARREEGGMRGLAWFGLCRSYGRLLPLVGDDAALGRPRRWSDGDFSADGEGRCACGIGVVRGGVGRGAVWVLRGKRRHRLGTAPAGDARREEGGMRGLVWLAQGVRAPPPACARRWGPRAAKALERRASRRGWGGALRLRYRDGAGSMGRGAVRV
jgi:hypothetical protein